MSPCTSEVKVIGYRILALSCLSLFVACGDSRTAGEATEHPHGESSIAQADAASESAPPASAGRAGFEGNSRGSDVEGPAFEPEHTSGQVVYRQFDFHDEASYGSVADIPDDTLPLGGGVLGQIASIRALSSGRVAVLDAAFKKIVVFDSVGEVLQILGKGHGQGPGEFLHPTAMDWDFGRFAVFDYSQSRITVFDSVGLVLATIPVPRAKDIALRGDTIFGTSMPSREQMLWSINIGSAERTITRMLSVDSRHSRFSPRGAIAKLGTGRDNGILVAHHRPGLWYVRSQGRFVGPSGIELLGGAEYQVYEGIPVPPGESKGIIALAPGVLGLLYVTIAGGDRQRPPRIGEWTLAFFDEASGGLLGSLPLPVDPTTVVATGHDEWEFLYAKYDPYPRVLRARIDASAGPGG
jgi:hypothetical protein